MNSFDTFKVVEKEKRWYWQRVRVHQGGPSVLYVTLLSDYEGPYATEILAWKAAIATLETSEPVSDNLSPEQDTIIQVINMYQKGIEVLFYDSKNGVIKNVHGLAVSAIKQYGDQRVAKAMSIARWKLDEVLWDDDDVANELKILLDGLGIVEIQDDKLEDADGRVLFADWLAKEHPHANRQECRLMRESYLQARKESKA